ncbi:MAG TPA: ATP-binding protein, partial [Vicinamibacteria bacterium]
FESLTVQKGLPNDFVRALQSDREGSLWVGTYSGGLCRLREGKFTNYTTREGLSYDVVRTVLEDRKGALWVGTTGGGLCRSSEGGFRCLGPPEGMARDVRALHEGPDGSLWVGTGGAGLVRLKDDRLVSYTRADGLPHPNLTAITDDGEGGLWLGTHGGGLARLRGGKFETFSTEDGLAGNLVLSVLRDRGGSIWAGTDGAGLSRLQGKVFTTFTAKDGLGSDIVFALFEAADGVLWIGTSGGLTRYRDGAFTTFGPRQGLIDDVVFSVLEDGKGDFWLGGNRGISRVSRADLEKVAAGQIEKGGAVIYGRADGMRSDECSGLAQPASWRGGDGRLYFPTAKGVVVVNPAHMPSNVVPPPVHVEEVVVDGQPLQGTSIPPGRQRFEFRYTGLSLLAPRKVQFRYRLVGFDPEWVEAGPLRAAYYTRLPPGAYTFKVKASNNDGVWNEDGDALEVVVRPFFWETRTFQALLTLSLVGLAALAYAVRVRNLERRRQELEGLVEVRTADLVREKERSESARAEAESQREAALRQREIAQEADRLKGELMSIAAHDLKTPLQSIIGYAELLLERPTGERVSEYANYGARAAQRMLDIVHKMLQSEAIESGQLSPDRHVVDVGRLGLATSGILQPQAEAKRQRIHAVTDEECLVEGDEDWLRQVLENLLGNAIKYSPERRSIWLEVRREGDQVRLRVRDEGPGLSDDDKTRVFGRFQRLSARPTGGESSTGLGLSIVRQLVERHGGRVWVESDGRGQGALFVVELPAYAPETRA